MIVHLNKAKHRTIDSLGGLLEQAQEAVSKRGKASPAIRRKPTAASSTSWPICSSCRCSAALSGKELKPRGKLHTGTRRKRNRSELDWHYQRRRHYLCRRFPKCAVEIIVWCH